MTDQSGRRRSDRVLARRRAGDDEHRERRVPFGPGLFVLLAAGLVVAAVTRASDDADPSHRAPEAPSLEAPVPVPVEAPESPVESSTSTSAATTTTRNVSQRPEVLSTTDEIDELAGTIVLSRFPNSMSETDAWVLGRDQRGHFGQRVTLPLYPGDFPYPLVVTENLVAFADLRDAHVFDREGGRLESISEASFLVPRATEEAIWVIGEGADWIARFDTRTREITAPIDVSDSVQWPLAGVNDGLLVAPMNDAGIGTVAYWTPDAGLQPLEPPVPDGFHPVAAAGGVAVFVGPEHVVRIVDLTAGDLVREFSVDLGGTTIIDGSLSPGAASVALVGATGEVVVAATGDGAIVQELRAVHSQHSVAWTAPHQLVALVEADEGVQLDAIDVATGQTATIATIGRQRLWMATAASSC